MNQTFQSNEFHKRTPNLLLSQEIRMQRIQNFFQIYHSRFKLIFHGLQQIFIEVNNIFCWIYPQNTHFNNNSSVYSLSICIDLENYSTEFGDFFQLIKYFYSLYLKFQIEIYTENSAASTSNKYVERFKMKKHSKWLVSNIEEKTFPSHKLK